MSVLNDPTISNLHLEILVPSASRPFEVIVITFRGSLSDVPWDLTLGNLVDRGFEVILWRDLPGQCDVGRRERLDQVVEKEGGLDTRK